MLVVRRGRKEQMRTVQLDESIDYDAVIALGCLPYFR